MEFYSDPAHNMDCRYRFTCGAAVCKKESSSSKPPSCYIDKFKRYQPAWHQRDWEEINRITWREVFSLKEAWIYTLITIVIVVFIFLVMILIKLVLKANRYY